jgi:putative endopeptidase
MQQNNLNTSEINILPSEDFNKNINGKWMENNPIPDKYTKWGTFEILHEENLNRLNNIIKDVDDTDKAFLKLKQIYESYMNESKLEDLDSYPIDKYMKEIDNCKSKSELWKLLANYYKYGNLAVFSFYPSEDAKDSKLVVPYLHTGGLGLPDRDYYFDDDKKETREKYQEYIESCWSLYYLENKNLSHILNLETKLAEKTYTRVEKRDPHKNYNKMNINKLKQLCNLDWELYFSKLVIRDIPYIIVDNKEFYKTFYDLWTNLNINIWKDYMKYKVISKFSSYMSNRFYKNKFDFYNKFLSGQKEPKPRWERAVSVVDNNFGELLGRKYVERHFPESSKVKMLEMVNNLKEELKNRIINLSWMSEETKEKALKKYNVFRAKIGYPDTWRDFSELEFDDKDTLVDMLMKVNTFEFNYEMNRLFKPTDLDRWEMDPHTINAYFHPLKNEIVFPAGILQKPFFDPEAEEATNYGAIGTVIGHEMTHSFDDMGSKFDHEGNLNNWWTDEDKEKFDKKAKYYIDEYAKLTVNCKNVNGELTLGENLADHGGVKISYYALKKQLEKTNQLDKILSGMTANEIFFTSWAIVWRTNIRPEEADKRLMTDPHSPNEWRINATLANIPEFHETYNVKPGDNMYRKNPVQMW